MHNAYTVKKRCAKFIHSGYFAGMSAPKSHSFPIRMPAELMDEIEAATKLTGLSQQDVMRLAMRIGLVDLRAAKNIAGIIQEVATDKGVSFLAWAKAQNSSTVETEETTLEAAGTKLKLISPTKASLSGQSGKSETTVPACEPQPKPASTATSTATARSRKPTRKAAANIAQLPMQHWHADDSKVAETPPDSSAGGTTQRESRA